MRDKAKTAQFVANIPVRVKKRKFASDSSDESDDGTFSPRRFDYNASSPPFKAKPTSHTSKKRILEDKVIERYEKNSPYVKAKSRSLAPLLDKLSHEAFEREDEGLINTNLKAVVGLNRMKSLSTRNNMELSLEMGANIETDIRYEKLGFFWKCKWVNRTSGKEVDYQTVKKFYKQLKRKDPVKAAEFLKDTESGIRVPYQAIREYIKDHEKTKKLVREARSEDKDANIYLSILDGDTVDFNGIYSAYLRLMQKNAPDVMSTGYEFPADELSGTIFQFASRLDRNIRSITNTKLPGAVYFPEPNLCVLIPDNSDTLPESFLDTSIRGQDLESAALIRKVKERGNITITFSLDNPLITRIMDRARLTKSKKTFISFSSGFTDGQPPTESDIRLLKQISQSHFNEKVWYDNLFINAAIDVRGPNRPACKSLLAKIRKSESAEKAEEYIKELQQYIPKLQVKALFEAIAEVKKYISRFKLKYERTEHHEELVEIIVNHDGLLINQFEREMIIILSHEDVVQLIKDNIISLQEVLLGLNNGLLVKDYEAIFYNDEILELFRAECAQLEQFIKLKKINDNLNEAISKIIPHLNEDDDFSQLVELYIKARGDSVEKIFDFENLIDVLIANDNEEDLEYGDVLELKKLAGAEFEVALQEIADKVDGTTNFLSAFYLYIVMNDEKLSHLNMDKDLVSKLCDIIGNPYEVINEISGKVSVKLVSDSETSKASTFPITFNYLLELYLLADKYDEPFDEEYQGIYWVVINSLGEHSPEFILEALSENSHHIRFLEQNYYGRLSYEDVVVVNYHDEDLVRLGITEYDVNIYNVREQLEGESLDKFNSIISDLREDREIDFGSEAEEDDDDETIYYEEVQDEDYDEDREISGYEDISPLSCDMEEEEGEESFLFDRVSDLSSEDDISSLGSDMSYQDELF